MSEQEQRREQAHAPKHNDLAQQWLYNLRRMAQRAIQRPDEAQRLLPQIVSELDSQLKNS
jgi:hypothetical protein